MPRDDRTPFDSLTDAFREPAASRSGSTAPTLWVDAEAWTECQIPRRNWVAPGYALRGSVTILAGPPSAMKSSLTLAWTCSIALGRDYGDFRPGARGTVIVYGVEDDRDEQRRRLSATLRQFEAVPAEIRGRIIITGPKAVGTLLGFDRMRENYATQLRQDQSQLLQQNPSGMTRQEIAIGQELNGYVAPR